MMTGMTSSSSNNGDTLYYFAIGSMMNPVSIKNRGLDFVNSFPGKISDQELHFFGLNGFAEAVYKPGSVMHGVIHETTHEQMERLDLIELEYIRKTVQAQRYDDGTTLPVTVYCRPDTVERGAVDGLPRERYIEILTAGAKHFGLDPCYVEFLENHPVQPRAHPKDYLQFCQFKDGANLDDLPVISLAELEKCDGSTDDKPLWMSSNGKVVEVAKNSKLYTPAKNWFSIDRAIELFLSKIAYDPRYGTPERLEDFTRQHSACLEHDFCDYMSKDGHLQDFTVVGRYKQVYKE